MTEHGSFIWNELATGDVERAKTFYGELLGWTYEAMEMAGGGTYTIARNAEKNAAGMMSLGDMEGAEGVPPHWAAYIAVDDVDARTARVAGLGGQVLRAPFDIPGVGRMSVIRDATGAVVCLITMLAPTG